MWNVYGAAADAVAVGVTGGNDGGPGSEQRLRLGWVGATAGAASLAGAAAMPPAGCWCSGAVEKGWGCMVQLLRDAESVRLATMR